MQLRKCNGLVWYNFIRLILVLAAADIQKLQMMLSRIAQIKCNDSCS